MKLTKNLDESVGISTSLTARTNTLKTFFQRPKSSFQLQGDAIDDT